jgi:hypothetical protein
MGDLDFEEGGNPVRMNRILAGSDPVLIDSYAAQLLGFEAEEIAYIPPVFANPLATNAPIVTQIFLSSHDRGILKAKACYLQITG